MTVEIFEKDYRLAINKFFRLVARNSDPYLNRENMHFFFFNLEKKKKIFFNFDFYFIFIINLFSGSHNHCPNRNRSWSFFCDADNRAGFSDSSISLFREGRSRL